MNEFAKQLTNIYNNKRATGIVVYNSISVTCTFLSAQKHVLKNQGEK